MSGMSEKKAHKLTLPIDISPLTSDILEGNPRLKPLEFLLAAFLVDGALACHLTLSSNRHLWGDVTV